MTRQTIQAAEQPLQKIFCDDYLFSIPSYQRPYAWKTEQAGELLDDVIAAWDQAAPMEEHAPYFLGSIVLIKDPQRPEADVVDGQQRLTTLTILLCVLRDLSPDFAQHAHGFVCQAGNPLLRTEDRYRLRLRERDAAFFESTIQKQGATAELPDARGLQDSQARIVENARLFRERLSALTPQQRQWLAAYLVQRCYLVVVAASDQDSAFRIFSVLNSRGLDLSPADILKAEIIGAVPPPQRDAYTGKWEELEAELGRARFAELFGHIRMIHRKQKMRGTLIAEFREFVPTRKEPMRFIDQELVPYGQAFEAVLDARFETYQHASEINALLSHLRRLDNADWQPPAIEVLARRKQEPAFILRFIRDLERLAYALFLLRADVNERLQRYGKVLEALQAQRDVFAEASPLQLTGAERRDVITRLDGDIYTETRIRLPLLLRLDASLAAAGADYDHPLITVEHVLPQTVPPESEWSRNFPDPTQRERWVHRIANLVLLTRRKNAQAGNLDFAEKKAKYFATKAGVTTFALTSQVLSEPVWTPDVLERRQKALVGKMSEVWRLG
ncbi:MAG: DUF262 domain-containing protein [Roseococcus sp.]